MGVEKRREVVAENIKTLKERIMNIWEDRVRNEVMQAAEKSRPLLRDKLPEFLDNLIDNISPDASYADRKRTGDVGWSHGEQRANIDDYTLSQVVTEYRILRQVIFQLLDEERLVYPTTRNIILDVISESIQKAIQRFAAVRTAELHRSNKELEHFAAIAAHDLKSPLSTISGYCELLQIDLEGKVSETDVAHLGAIRRLVASMSQLVDRLLEYSSMGRLKQPFSVVSMEKVVAHVAESLKIAVEESGAKVTCDKLPDVVGQESLLTQLFQNLISNAIKFRKDGRDPEIKISCTEFWSHWQFSVKDNGLGFDISDHDNVFDLFKKGPSESGEIGHGIGLATVRKIVEIHGGQVWADSKLGEGSTFFFTIEK